MPNSLNSFLLDKEPPNDNLQFVCFHESVEWLQKLKQGLDTYFFEGVYDPFDIEFYLGFPSYVDGSYYGYWEPVFQINGDEVSTIFIAPGVMSVDQLVACVFHELIHAYGGVYGHSGEFKAELARFRVSIGPDNWECFEKKDKRAISTILRLIGEPPQGLVNEFSSTLLAKAQIGWAESSINYCPICFKKNIRVFSELRQKKLCSHSKESHMSVRLPPSYLPLNVLLDADHSWPWFGSLSPVEINHKAGITGFSEELIVLDSFSKKGERVNLISMCPSQNSFKVKSLNCNKWKLTEKYRQALRVSTDANFDLIVFNFAEKYDKVLKIDDAKCVSEFIQRVNDIRLQKNLISITTLK